MNTLARFGILEPNYEVTVAFDEDAIDRNVVDVVWSAPDPYFTGFPPADGNSELAIRAWRPFQIDAEVTSDDSGR